MSKRGIGWALLPFMAGPLVEVQGVAVVGGR